MTSFAGISQTSGAGVWTGTLRSEQAILKPGSVLRCRISVAEAARARYTLFARVMIP